MLGGEHIIKVLHGERDDDQLAKADQHLNELALKKETEDQPMNSEASSPNNSQQAVKSAAGGPSATSSESVPSSLRLRQALIRAK